MNDTTWSGSRASGLSAPPLLVILVGAHLMNPLFGLVIAEREPATSLLLEPHKSAGFGLLCAQATLLGLWATFAASGWLARLAPALLLLALAAIAPAVIYGDFVTSRYTLLPFAGMLLLTPLRLCGVQLKRPQPPRNPLERRVQISLLQLQCLMAGIAVTLGINGELLWDRNTLSRFDFQLAGFAVAYTLLFTVVVCLDSTRGYVAWLLRATGFLALAALPFLEAMLFQSRPDFDLLLRELLLPLHGAQCLVVFLSVLVLHTAGYRLERMPLRKTIAAGWRAQRKTDVAETMA